MNINKTGYIRNNENLKAPNYTEHITKEEYDFRIQELIKCRQDPIYFAEHYFTIISPGKGKHIIKLYPKQKELILKLVNEDRVIVLASRQVGKTTAYNIYALWTAMFHEDQNILICSNVASTAFEFVGRIRLAYEDIPMWLKPGIVEWNTRKIKFNNDSTIGGSATSPSVRGKSCNILILDEFAFVENEKEFWEAVYPVISASKGTKVIIVSTSNGTGNLFYKFWKKAELEIDDEGLGFKSHRIDWWEHPERDEEWKKKTIESMGDIRAFNIEFGNCFYGSACTLIDSETIRQYTEWVVKNKKPHETMVMGILKDFELKIWEKPHKEKVYIVGADVGDGIGSDFSTIFVFDVSDVLNTRLVASFRSNTIKLNEFSYLLTKVALLYNNAYIGIENNGVGNGVIENMFNIYEYDNFINYGMKGRKLGIFSHNTVKVEACHWFKYLLENKHLNFELYDKNLVDEIEWFEKDPKKKHDVFKATKTKHDDCIMAFIWAMFALNEKIAENYYDVIKHFQDEFGRLIPRVLRSYSNHYYSIQDDFNQNPMDMNGDSDRVDRLFASTLKGDSEQFLREKENMRVSEEDIPTSLGFINNDEFYINDGF